MRSRFLTLFFLFFLFSSSLRSQTSFKAIVKDSITHETLIGVAASIENTKTGASSDETGLITINNIQDGKQRIVFYFIGYKKLIQTFDFPMQTKYEI